MIAKNVSATWSVKVVVVIRMSVYVVHFHNISLLSDSVWTISARRLVSFVNKSTDPERSNAYIRAEELRLDKGSSFSGRYINLMPGLQSLLAEM